MRIQDKHKSKSKPSSSSGGGGGGGGGENADTTATTSSQSPSPPVTNVHACVESGDLIGLQQFLIQNPFSLNERSIFVRFSFYYITLSLVWILHFSLIFHFGIHRLLLYIYWIGKCNFIDVNRLKRMMMYIVVNFEVKFYILPIRDAQT